MPGLGTRTAWQVQKKTGWGVCIIEANKRQGVPWSIRCEVDEKMVVRSTHAPGVDWALWSLACKHWEATRRFSAGVQNNHIGL